MGCENLYVYGRDVTLSEARYYNQGADQYRSAYEDCVKKGYMTGTQYQIEGTPVAP